VKWLPRDVWSHMLDV